MAERDEVYLRHILEAVNLIRQYLTGVTREEFMTNRMLQDAVIRELEIIGEAANTFRPT